MNQRNILFGLILFVAMTTAALIIISNNLSKTRGHATTIVTTDGGEISSQQDSIDMSLRQRSPTPAKLSARERSAKGVASHGASDKERGEKPVVGGVSTNSPLGQPVLTVAGTAAGFGEEAAALSLDNYQTFLPVANWGPALLTQDTPAFPSEVKNRVPWNTDPPVLYGDPDLPNLDNDVLLSLLSAQPTLSGVNPVFPTKLIPPPGAEPASQPNSPPDSQPANQPNSPPDSHPANQPNSPLNSQLANQPNPPLESKPASQANPPLESKPASQPNSLLVSQPASKPKPPLESKPANQPNSLLDSQPASKPKPPLETKPASQPNPPLDSHPANKPATPPNSDTTVLKPDTKSGNRPLVCQSCFRSDFTILSDAPDVCAPRGGVTPELVVVVTSSTDGAERRSAIRETWASASRNNTAPGMRHVFLLGTTPDANLTRRNLAESGRYRDVIMADFVDSYANLTLKTMVGLRWIVTHCGDVKFFMKTDQDMYVFPERVLALVRKNEKTLLTSIGGACQMTGRPFRDNRSKYYASVRSYPQSTYPGFCSGTGYVSTLAVARMLVQTSPDVPFFHLEDVYLALVMRHLGLRLTKYNGFLQPAGVCNNPRLARKTVTIHQLSPATIRHFWKTQCGVVPERVFEPGKPVVAGRGMSLLERARLRKSTKAEGGTEVQAQKPNKPSRRRVRA